ncbi:putative ankyrin repeat protein [Daldinia decipiens]|uniref:putative ankyrin repeat protein n=1 Tax=Daldinia decipiens TaxID=326647 RepID=UPI0020C4F296|nr:putative ankyrin repeat protein [Daldinia decipiens]KAI1654827.1 putative ankyrin repeat protein [Daldinia decipiens]
MGDDWWDDFSNNLATDLAPLISLFGENPTKQYLSECLTILDIIIFSMAPLGIITAVVSAIRVCGTPSLRAFVGRAQEGAGTAEAELCSSTSRDVCELYTNGGIARVFGRPKLLEVVHDPKYSANAFYPTDGSKPTAGIYSFQQYIETERGRKGWKETQKRNKSSGSDEEKHIRAKPARFAPNPNLSLNIGIKPLDRGWFVFAAILGIMMQSFVLVWAVLTKYYFQWTRTSNQDHYAVPLMAIGTILLCLGMALCAYLIKSKTKEHMFERKVSPNIKSRFYWVQPGNQTIGDQMFDPFGYSDTKFPLQKYITSYKDRKGNTMMDYIWTAFLGLRACHSSVSVLQLGLRTRRLREQDNCMTGDPTLFQGHELDWLALKIGQSDTPSESNSCKWKVVSIPRKSCADVTIGSFINVSSNPEAHERERSCVLERLQGISGGVTILSGFRIQLHNSNPPESLTKLAEKAISRWISEEYCTRKTQHDCTPSGCELGPNATVKTFFYRSRLARMTGLGEPESEHSSHWAFCIFWAIQSSCSLKDGTIQMSLRRAINKDGLPEGPWKAEASEIEAVLGLWFWSLKEQEPRDSQEADDVGSKKFDKRISRFLSTDEYRIGGSAETKALDILRGGRELKIQKCRFEVQDSSAQLGSGNVPKTEGNEHHANQSLRPGRNINRAEVENGMWWRSGLWEIGIKEFVVRVGQNDPFSEPDDQRRFFGWCNTRYMKDTSLYDGFDRFYALEIYSSFLSAIMTAVQDIGQIEAREHRGGTKVNNETDDKIQEILVKRGLCEAEDAFACTIPILRNQHKLQLPGEVFDTPRGLGWLDRQDIGKLIDSGLDRAYSSLGSTSEQERSFGGLEAINRVRRAFIGACELYRQDILRRYDAESYWGIIRLLQRYSRDEKIMRIPLVWVDFGGHTDSSNRQSTLSLAETIKCYATAALHHLKRDDDRKLLNIEQQLQTELGEEIEPKVKADNLFQAIKESDLSATLYFLGREPLDEPSKTSAFIDACQLGWYMVVDVLLELGAGEDQYKDIFFYASQVGDINMARIFVGKIRGIQGQNDKNNNDDKDDNYDYRCMVVREVAKRGHAIILKDMIQTWKSRSIFDDDRKDMTPLSLAIIPGHCDIVNLLLSNRLAKPNDPRTKLPALHLAIAEGKEDVVKLLLNFDEVYPNWINEETTDSPPLNILNAQRIDADWHDKTYRSALWWAAALGLDSYVQKLLSSGGVHHPNRWDKNGDTPLSIAVQAGHRGVVDLLLKIPETIVNLKAILIAGKKGYQDIVEKVLPRIAKSELDVNMLTDKDERRIWYSIEENVSWDKLNKGGKEIDWNGLGIDERFISASLDYASQLATEPFHVIRDYRPTNQNSAENQGHASFRGKALDEETDV